MRLLLGSIAKVVGSTNKSQIGLSGWVVHEAQSKNNHSLVLYNSETGFKRVNHCLLKVDNSYIWTPSRENRLIKKMKTKLSGYNEL